VTNFCFAPELAEMGQFFCCINRILLMRKKQNRPKMKLIDKEIISLSITNNNLKISFSMKPEH